jgi:glycosyltransferase involved in cell wall biosynthesis
MSAPEISIVTATYDRARTIRRTIDSLLAQTFTAWEHIIVDDGSKDDTFDRVKRYVTGDPRVVYVRKPNGGAVSAMNMGITLARGTYVTFLDSDDAYEPQHLALRLRYLRAHPSVDLVWGGLRAVGPKNRQYFADVERPGKRIHASECRVCGTIVVKRTVLRRVRGFRKLVSADYDLCRRVEASGGKIARVRYPTLVYYVAGDDRMSVRQKNLTADGKLSAETP